MANKNTLKSSDIVIEGKDKDGKKFRCSAQSFSLCNFDDCTVSGIGYYVDKACKLGAKKAK